MHLDKGPSPQATPFCFPKTPRAGRKSGMAVIKLRKDPSPPRILAALRAKGSGRWRLQEGGRTGTAATHFTPRPDRQPRTEGASRSVDRALG